MAVHPHITRTLDNNYVQIDVNSKKAPTRYFRVPKTLADEFCKSYKKRDKRDTLISNGVTFGSGILACAAIYPFTRKIGSTARMTLGIIGGIAAAIGSTILANKIMIPKHEKFIKSFNAEEIYYDNKKFPV